MKPIHSVFTWFFNSYSKKSEFKILFQYYKLQYKIIIYNYFVKFEEPLQKFKLNDLNIKLICIIFFNIVMFSNKQCMVIIMHRNINELSYGHK